MAGRQPSALERNKRFRVPDAELDVLSCLWILKRATTKDIRNRLARERPMAHATVATLLSRLEKKGWVARKKGSHGKAFVYFASRTDQIVRSQLARFVERVFQGDVVAMVAAAVQIRPPSADQCRRIRRILAAPPPRGSTAPTLRG